MNFIKNNLTIIIPGANWKFNLLIIFIKPFLPRNALSNNEKPVEKNVEPEIQLPIEFKNIFKKLYTLLTIEVFSDGSINEIIEKNKNNPSRLFISPSDVHNDESNILKAFLETKGATVLHIQHGSSYGVLKEVDPTAYVEYQQKMFITWGWTKYFDHFSTKFHPLPIPILSLQRKK